MKRAKLRPRSEPAFDRGGGGPELSAYGGIVSGFLASYANEWGVTPAAVLDAIGREGVAPMVDTAQPASGRETHTRPADPNRRCLAFTAEAFEQLARAVATPGANV